MMAIDPELRKEIDAYLSIRDENFQAKQILTIIEKVTELQKEAAKERRSSMQLFTAI